MLGGYISAPPLGPKGETKFGLTVEDKVQVTDKTDPFFN